MKKLYFYCYQKLRGIVTMIKFYHNWPTAVLDHAKLPLGKTVKYCLKNGLKIITRPNTDDRYVLDGYLFGEYQIKKKLNPSSIVIDIGGHIGVFALNTALKVSHGQVFVFEPSLANFKMLKENLSLNKLKNVKIFNQAVFNRNQKIKLYLTWPYMGTCNLFHQTNKFEMVKTVSLPWIFKKCQIKKCHLLKIDCEGAEYEIITSLPTNIFKKIDQIIYEEHHVLSCPDKYINLKKLLISKSYKLLVSKKNQNFNCRMVYAEKL